MFEEHADKKRRMRIKKAMRVMMPQKGTVELLLAAVLRGKLSKNGNVVSMKT